MRPMSVLELLEAAIHQLLPTSCPLRGKIRSDHYWLRARIYILLPTFGKLPLAGVWCSRHPHRLLVYTSHGRYATAHLIGWLRTFRGLGCEPSSLQYFQGIYPESPGRRATRSHPGRLP